jgi:RHS repeat-associated protein
VRELDPDTLQPVADTWTDYVGETPVLDFVIENGEAVPVTAYLPGISHTDVAADATYYFHTDHLGSTWYTSKWSGSDYVLSKDVVRTAFGEKVNPQITTSRYGYAGAWGYQEHDMATVYGDPATPDGRPDSHFNASPTAGFPFMHVGHRYYHPGSGRFLQRDPIGIRGGLNVYEYVRSNPSVAVDPMGLFSIEKAVVRVIGVIYGALIGGLPGAVVGAAVTGGWEDGDAMRLHGALQCYDLELTSPTIMRVHEIGPYLNVHPEEESTCCLCGRPPKFDSRRR